MHEVSAAYLQAMKQLTQRHKLDLYLKNPIAREGFEMHLTENNIEAGSFEYMNQCSDGKDMTLGSVCIGQISLTIISFGILNQFIRGEWVGGTVRPVFSMLVDEENDIWESVPVGVFEIGAATWSEKGLKITAYDNMSKFDKPIRTEAFLGIPFQIITAICNACGVEFGQDAYQLQYYPNANEVLGLYPENDIKTYRDMLSWISQALGGFATAGRDGKIYIKRFAGPNEYVDTIDINGRYSGATFSDYTTKYTRITDGTDEDGNTVAWGDNSGVTVDLGGNPFLSYGSNVYIDRQHEAILAEVKKWNFTPFNCQMLGNPVYDLGDALKFTGGIAGNNGSVGAICKQVWKFKKSYAVSGFGKNPKFSAADTTNKAVNKLQKQSKTAAVRYFRFSNIGEYSWIAEGYDHVRDEKTIGFIDFVASGDNIAEFWAQVQLHARTWTAGLESAHIITRAYIDDEVVAQVTDTLDPAGYGSVSDTPIYETILGVDTVEAKPHRVKFTVQILDCWEGPTWQDFIIEVGGFRATLKGQGLTTESDWDGNLKFEADVNTLKVSIENENLVENFGGVSLQIPTIITLSDYGQLSQRVGVGVTGITEEITITKSLDPNWPIAGDGFIANNNLLI